MDWNQMYQMGSNMSQSQQCEGSSSSHLGVNSLDLQNQGLMNSDPLHSMVRNSAFHNSSNYI